MKVILFILLLVSNLCAEETKLMDGTTWRRIKTCEETRKIEVGDKTKRQVNGEWVYVKKLKASDYIPPGEILPLQATEDNRDGNTDFVIIRTDTRERIAKDITPKGTMYAGPDNN